MDRVSSDLELKFFVICKITKSEVKSSKMLFIFMSLIQAGPFENVTILMKSTKCIIFDLPYHSFWHFYFAEKMVRWPIDQSFCPNVFLLLH